MSNKIKSNSIIQKSNSPKNSFPKSKTEGLKNAIKNTDMLKVIEGIHKERITRP
jgi:hypothetical protein